MHLEKPEETAEAIFGIHIERVAGKNTSLSAQSVWVMTAIVEWWVRRCFGNCGSIKLIGQASQ
jgi:hypothetical protein